jgi:O-antigen ligase
MGLGQLRVYTLFVFIPLIFGCIQLNKTQRDGILLSFARTMMCFLFITLAYWFYQTTTMGIPAMNWIILGKFRISNQAVYDIVLGWCNYHHPTYSGYSMLTALIVYYYHCSHNNTSKGKTYAETFIYSLGSLAVLVLIQSRTGVISWAIVNALGLAYLLRKNKKKLVGYSITLAVLSCFVLLYKHQAVMDYIEDPIREQNIKTAAYFIQKHPLLGSGIEGIRTEMASHEVAHLLGYAYAHTAFGNPHHQWIGDWMQTGIVGLALITIIVGQLFYKSIKNRNWMLGMFGIVSLILMQIEMPFYLHKGVVSFLLFTCLMEFPNHTSIQQLNKKGLS